MPRAEAINDSRIREHARAPELDDVSALPVLVARSPACDRGGAGSANDDDWNKIARAARRQRSDGGRS